MALPRGAVTDLDAGDVGPQFDDLAVELVTDHERRHNGGSGPVVPLLKVQVGAAEPGAQHAQHHIVRPASRFRSVDELEARPGRQLGESAHKSPSARHDGGSVVSESATAMSPVGGGTMAE